MAFKRGTIKKRGQLKVGYARITVLRRQNRFDCVNLLSEASLVEISAKATESVAVDGSRATTSLVRFVNTGRVAMKGR